MPVHSTAMARMAAQARTPGICAGHSHSVGKARPSAAPSWLPAAVANGGPAPEKVTEAVYARTQQVTQLHTADTQDVALDAFAQDFEVWKYKEPALTIMQIPDDGPFHKERIWYRQFYNPRDKAAEFQRRVNGVHTTIDKRPGAKSKAA